jgi:hypothetical protein
MSNKSLIAGMLSLFATALSAQTITPAQFKQLCETSPMNTIVLRAPTKILGTAPVVTAVNSPCRINFLSGAKLEADQAAFSFAGQLVLQAGPTVEVNLVKSYFEATSFQITEGRSSILNLTESTLKSTGGDITVGLGADGNVSTSMPYAGQLNALESAGAITINGGARSTFSLINASAAAGTSFAVNFSGTQATFQLQNSQLSAAGGPLSLIAPGQFANFDLSSATLSAASGINLSARGREGKITGSQVEFNAGSGSVDVIAGAGAAAKGEVVLKDAIITAGGAVNVLGSRNAIEGFAVVEVSTIDAGGAIRIEAGNGGTATAINNRLTSPSSIQVFTPPSGSCVAENNAASAPVLRLCR